MVGLDLRGKGNGGGKMADQGDDLGILVRPTPRAPEPSKITDGGRSGAEPNTATPLPATPNFLRGGAQPGQAPLSPRPKTDQSFTIRDNGVEPRKLIVGQGTFLSGEINSCDRIIVLSEGGIVEEGTFAELLQSGGLFALMARKQGMVSPQLAPSPSHAGVS